MFINYSFACFCLVLLYCLQQFRIWGFRIASLAQLVQWRTGPKCSYQICLNPSKKYEGPNGGSEGFRSAVARFCMFLSHRQTHHQIRSDRVQEGPHRPNLPKMKNFSLIKGWNQWKDWKPHPTVGENQEKGVHAMPRTKQMRPQKGGSCVPCQAFAVRFGQSFSGLSHSLGKSKVPL